MPTTTNAEDAASIFTVQELGGKRRTVQLFSRALPYRPFVVSCGQRFDNTWLPGVAESTLTILGPQEFPATINGYWKDKFLGPSSSSGYTPPMQLDGSPVTKVRDAVDLWESITLEGQLLEVTWFVLKRQGIITRFTPKWHNTHDAEWEISFEWMGRGQQMGAPVFASSTGMGDTANLFRKSMSDFTGLSLNLPLSNPLTTLIASLTNTLQDSIDTVENTVMQLASGIVSPINALKGLVSTCASIVDDTNLMIKTIGNTVSQAYTSMAPVDTTAADLIEIELFRREMLAQLRAIRSLAMERRDALVNDIDGDLEGRYIARAGQDLRDVARIFYNTTFEWRRIMLFNQLDSPELSAGQLVLVPKINPQNIQGNG